MKQQVCMHGLSTLEQKEQKEPSVTGETSCCLYYPYLKKREKKRISENTCLCRVISLFLIFVFFFI